jgi:hypothetical protein
LRIAGQRRGGAMEKTRREVLVLIVGGVAAAACGGSSGNGGNSSGSNCLANGTTSQIETNHGHTLSVPVADINAGVDKTYTFGGTADHTHSLTLTAADFAQLRQNMGTQRNSTTNASITFGSHLHTVLISCA